MNDDMVVVPLLILIVVVFAFLVVLGGKIAKDNCADGDVFIIDNTVYECVEVES